MMVEHDVEKMKVDELKKELTARGLDATGLKAVLQKRLKEALIAEAEATALVDVNASVAQEGGGVGQDQVAIDLEGAAEVGSDAVEKDQGGADTKPGEEAGTEATSAEQVAQKAVEEDAVEAARRRRAERFGVPYEPLRKALTVKEPQKSVKATEEKKRVELDPEEVEKRRIRAAKFGLGEKTAKDSLSEEGLLKGKLKRRSTSAEDDEKKKARAGRFG